MRARDLFFMWTSDLFMKRVQRRIVDRCVLECPGLYDVHGEEFEKCTPIMKKRVKVEKPSKRMNCGRKS
jgi:ribonucleoside-diphosphate reductase alpha chain